MGEKGVAIGFIDRLNKKVRKTKDYREGMVENKKSAEETAALLNVLRELDEDE
ncbi:MAG: hypothetical protein QF415_03025 [Candidatus Undinarchaeales archaeon]|jgi:hypothetical protein|nr:hypothetical protein [Candidatus Undinarchaeales archaeon]MDP7492797.1 hypothetical protein [Candidatus Undinarchaeales archaeon]